MCVFEFVCEKAGRASEASVRALEAAGRASELSGIPSGRGDEKRQKK